jgi:ArsR family transcriptional regulator
VCEICHILGVSQSTTSRHLQILEEAGLIYAVKEGKWVNYHIAENQYPHNARNSESAEILELISTWLEEGEEQVDSDRSKIGCCSRDILCS